VDLTHPARAVVPSLDVDVLAVLVATTQPLTGRQIHRMSSRGSWSGVRRVLERLERHGLVDVVQAGSANLYSLNRDHVAFTAVLALVDLRGRLFVRIQETLRAWLAPPVAAAVFGSAARGDGSYESDIDLFLVRPEDLGEQQDGWDDAVAELAMSVRRWSGNPASIIQATPTQVGAMLERQEPIGLSLRQDAIPLIGPNILDVARAAE
jgi:DNA-binding transcriptional ArsR family regulator